MLKTHQKMKMMSSHPVMVQVSIEHQCCMYLELDGSRMS